MNTTSRAFVPNLCQAEAVLAVILVAQVLVFVFALVAASYHAFSWLELGRITLFVQWVALTSAALLCALKQIMARLKAHWVALLVVALVCLVTLLLSVLALNVETYVQGFQWRWWQPQVAINVAVAALVAGLLVRYWYLQAQLRWQSEAELEARIQALQARIRPHFLFNSMNIIASLIAINPEQAEQAVEDLAELFRMSLENHEKEIPLSKELALCQRYGRLEQWRMGERLRWRWEIEVAAENYLVPALCLQPLLENAVYHGVQKLEKGGEIVVHVKERAATLVVQVTNPVLSIKGESPSGQRMALANIRARLEVLYGKQAGLKTTYSAQQFKVLLWLPVRRNDANTRVR